MSRFTQNQRWSLVPRTLVMCISVAAITLTARGITIAQTVDVDRVLADLEPEIQRTPLDHCTYCNFRI